MTRWATAHGLTAQVAPGRTMVQVSGSSRAVAAAFGAALHTFRLADGTTVRANAAQGRLPHAVAQVASAVVGLSDMKLRVPQPKTHPSGTVTIINSFGPQDFWSIYHAPAAATGAGQNLAIITAGDISQAKSDLPKFEDHFGLPHVPFNEIHVGPASTVTSRSRSSTR